MDLVQTYDRLVAMSGEAFESRHYEVAHHLLEAAAHCARELRDGGRLEAVGRLAGAQGAWLADHNPGHRLSPVSAAARGNPGIHELLRRTVEGMMALLHAEQVQAATRIPVQGPPGRPPS
jgi:hypothetical protein